MAAALAGWGLQGRHSVKSVTSIELLNFHPQEAGMVPLEFSGERIATTYVC